MGVKQNTKTLFRRNVPLAQPRFQFQILERHTFNNGHFPTFSEKISEHKQLPLTRGKLEILQLNLGKLCNQTCKHCHVDAGPDRKDQQMSREILQQALSLIETYNIPTVDLTGGAPEMNEHFKWFVEACFHLGVHIIDRCNLTILNAGKKYEDLPRFLADHHVHVVSSLPHYNKKRTDAQRGDGVFESSILGLQKLNALGYGQPDSDLILDLVYNPTGIFLPSSQSVLEPQFKRKLKNKFDVDFNNLIAITNMPISRFLEYLLETDNYERYMFSLLDAFNPATLEGVMCRNTLSVGWDGSLYDCDFNQMLNLKSDLPNPTIFDLQPDKLEGEPIVVHQACYGCTAGAGSSCGGEIA